MRALLALFVLLTLSTNSFAGEIRNGAIMQVKPNSIWFQDVKKFARWQQLKRSGNATALRSYQDTMLSQRDAWQFVNALTVKIISYEPANDRVKVEMKTDGRMLGTTWFLEAAALTQ